MISNSLDINFICGDIHGRSCKKVVFKQILAVWYKTKFGSQNLSTKFGVFLVIYVMF